MAKSLADLRVGESGRVCRVIGEGVRRLRLLEMGLTPGAPVTLQKRAPFGDPLEFSVRNYELTLRRSEARLVLVNP